MSLSFMFIHENTLRIIPTPMLKRKFYLMLRFTTNKQTRVINDVVSVSAICSTGRDVQTGLQKGSFNGNNYLCVANGGDNHSAPFDVSLATAFYLLFVFLKTYGLSDRRSRFRVQIINQSEDVSFV